MARKKDGFLRLRINSIILSEINPAVSELKALFGLEIE